jgi:nitric oxide reductase subunit B
MSQKKLWIALTAVIVLSFAVLLYYGNQIYQQAPPVPAEVVDDTGTVLFTGGDIKDGQNIWQSIGGQEIGTVWGHGAYVAPDWTADYLHREPVDTGAEGNTGKQAADIPAREHVQRVVGQAGDQQRAI